jgi:VanZ family protein
VNRYSHLHWDHVLNVLFYAPVGPLAAALGWPMSVGVGAGVVLSFAAEASQVFSENRAPDGNDVVANIAGAVAGAVAWSMYRRRTQRQPLSLLTSGRPAEGMTRHP